MCGIFFTNDPNISSAQFNKAFNLMKHRGPDNSAVLKYKRISG